MEFPMANTYSRQSLLDFLDYLSSKGLMKKTTAVSRKAAVSTLLSILSEEEASNLSKLDVEGLVQRFANLKGSDFTPGSLRTYKSRLTSVIADFESYKKDPLSFRPQISPKERTTRGPQSVAVAKTSQESTPSAQSHSTEDFSTRTEEIIFPIPIRKGVVVKVAGIPSDLTPEEATKIGNVILALSGSQED
jgi:hypothetical protein